VTDGESDLSDDDDYMEPADDPDRQLVSLRQALLPTTRKDIRRLFYNTDKV